MKTLPPVNWTGIMLLLVGLVLLPVSDVMSQRWPRRCCPPPPCCCRPIATHYQGWNVQPPQPRWAGPAVSYAWQHAPSVAVPAPSKLQALIVDGQNNHGNWPQTSQMMKSYLEESGLFEVDVTTTAPRGIDEHFAPEFSKYDVVVSNYNGEPWLEDTQNAFEHYMKNGGGFVTVHAADNAFPDWPEYNEMIGLGGWGGRNQANGPWVYYNAETGEVVRDNAEGPGGHHGRQHDFRIIVRDSEHPVTRGMPGAWMHVKDELYDKLRGPANNMQILATAFADPETGGSGRHEPMIFTIEYGEGRVFHLPLGHSNESQMCTGFITTFLRGAEWAASGKVSQPIPDDFPTMDATRSREFATGE
ncbi:MAG: ThuA domain-containing protein [Pirellulaceae bacterium]